MSPAILDALLQLGTFGLGSGVFAVLFGSLVKHWLDRVTADHGARLEAEREVQRGLLLRDVEEHKTRLSAQAQIELARLQADLRLGAFREETQFAHLHQSRADVVATFYAKLARADVALRSLMNPLQRFTVPSGLDADEEREFIRDRTKSKANEAIRAFNEMLEYVLPVRIYFDSATVKRIDDLALELHLCVDEFTTYGLHAEDAPSNREFWESRRKAWSKLTGDIDGIKRDLEKRFRGLLGVE